MYVISMIMFNFAKLAPKVLDTYLDEEMPTILNADELNALQAEKGTIDIKGHLHLSKSLQSGIQMHG